MFFRLFFRLSAHFRPTLVQYFIQIPHIISCFPLSAYDKWWFEQKNHHIFWKSIKVWATLIAFFKLNKDWSKYRSNLDVFTGLWKSFAAPLTSKKEVVHSLKRDYHHGMVAGVQMCVKFLLTQNIQSSCSRRCFKQWIGKWWSWNNQCVVSNVTVSNVLLADWNWSTCCVGLEPIFGQRSVVFHPRYFLHC